VLELDSLCWPPVVFEASKQAGLGRRPLLPVGNFQGALGEIAGLLSQEAEVSEKQAGPCLRDALGLALALLVWHQSTVAALACPPRPEDDMFVEKKSLMGLRRPKRGLDS
jgi:hypothetical protein